MSIDFRSLGRTISEIRKECGYTQKQVYEVTKVSIETQRRIEHGLKEPKISTLERLSMLYKVDLLKLAIEERDHISFFSDKMIGFFNRMVWERDLEKKNIEIAKYLVDLGEYIESISPGNQLELELAHLIKKFVVIIQDIRFTEIRNKAHNSILLENILIQLDKSGKFMLEDRFQLNIEITFGIFLCNLYNFNGDTDKAQDLLDRLWKSVINAPIHDLRMNDYKLVIAMNRMVLYQIKGEYEALLLAVDQVLEDPSYLHRSIMFMDILMLKGLAMYKLGHEGYEHFINTLMNLEKGSRKDMLIEELESYGITITPSV